MLTPGSVLVLAGAFETLAAGGVGAVVLVAWLIWKALGSPSLPAREDTPAERERHGRYLRDARSHDLSYYDWLDRGMDKAAPTDSQSGVDRFNHRTIGTQSAPPPNGETSARPASDTAFIECPRCAEHIRPRAVVCRFCGLARHQSSHADMD